MLNDHRRAFWYALALLGSLGFVLFAVGRHPASAAPLTTLPFVGRFDQQMYDAVDHIRVTPLTWMFRFLSVVGGGVVTDIHGVRYDGPVRRATKDKLELKTRYGSVMTGWLNLSPDMLLKMSIAFIRPGVVDVPERQWLCAIFAAHTGQTAAANELAEKAAAAKANFRDLLPRFFPTAKK